MARAPIVMLWRSDYVYPRGLYESISASSPITTSSCPTPSHRRPHVRANFVREKLAKLRTTTPISGAPIPPRPTRSMKPGPVTSRSRAKTWARLGGLNHRLWGYGWQLVNSPRASAVICRAVASNTSITTGPSTEPRLVPHVRSEGFDAKKSEEDRVGRQRFAEFLGGRKCSPATSIRWNQKLPPIPPYERQ